MEGSITQLGLKNYLINHKKDKESFFRHTYKNFGNFVKSTLKFNFNGKFDFGMSSSFRIDKDARYGDFITNMVLKIKLPKLTGTTTFDTVEKKNHYVDGVGNALIEKITLKIGGHIVDEQTGEWLDIWSSLNVSSGSKDNYRNMVKKNNTYDSFKDTSEFLYIPLQFWFCQFINKYENIPMVLPLVSFKNTPIEIIIKTRKFSELLTYGGFKSSATVPNETTKSIESAELLIDYVVLENEERIKYLESQNQIYLVTQVQQEKFTIGANQEVLQASLKPFKYPITELLWVFRTNNNLEKHDYFNYSGRGSVNNANNKSYYKDMKISFDGRDRVDKMEDTYYSRIETAKHHNNVDTFSRINTYSFSLDPTNFAQPSGSCNFSGLFNPTMEFNLNTEITGGVPAGELIVFGINYNVLQINNNGNACLLHNLSKNTPDLLPNYPRGKLITDCNLTVQETEKAKELIAYINELNIFKDPRKIETGLANIIQNKDLQDIIKDKLKSDKGMDSIQDVTTPILDSLVSSIDELSLIIKKARQDGDDDTLNERKYLDLAGMVIDMDDSVKFFNDLLYKYLGLNTNIDFSRENNNKIYEQ